MEDMENVLMELSSLEKTPQVASIPPCLDEYLASVASTGKAVFAWAKVKPLFRRKLELIIQEFSESSPVENLARQPNVDMFNFEQMKERIFEQLESYTGLPFTIQRLCELMVQPKKHYKRIDKYMRGLEKVMLVVSTVDPIPGTGEPEASKNDSSGSTVDFESPSKRIRLASAEDDEAGPCDSADSEASAELQNGVNGSSSEAAEAGGSDASAGEENMDIDTECTSSQARLSVTDTASADTPSSDDQSSSSGGGVESTADPSPSPHLDTDSPMDTEDRLAAPDTGPVASSSSGDGVTSDGVTTSDQDQTPGASAETKAGVEESGAASSSGDQTAVVAQETDNTNSEAEPAASDNKENFTEAAVEEAGAEAGSSDQITEEQQKEVASPSVQSSEEPSQTESSASPAPNTDSGAADSSDQAQAPAQGEVTASEAEGEATPSVTSEAAEAGSSEQASAEAEASDNSPTQSDTPAQ